MLEEHPVCVSRWVRDFVPDSKRHALLDLRHFTEITGVDAPKFVDFAKSHDSVEVLDLIRKARDSLSETNPGRSVGIRFENHTRSFLKYNGVSSLPPSRNNTYIPESWHRGYKRDEIKNILANLGEPHHRLYVIMATETGLRAQNLLDLRYRHIKEDFEADVVPCAIRFEPKYYNRTKAAGFTFLGKGSVKILKEMIAAGILKREPDALLVGITYQSIQHAIYLARRKANISEEVQPNHGFSKFFENQLDKAGLDHNRKAMLEGHFGGTRAKHYTDREWDQLRDDYKVAYPFLDLSEPDPDQIEQEKRIDELQKTVDYLKAERSKEREIESEVREYLPVLKMLGKDPVIKKRLAQLQNDPVIRKRLSQAN